MERKNLALLCAGVVCFWLFALAFGTAQGNGLRQQNPAVQAAADQTQPVQPAAAHPAVGRPSPAAGRALYYMKRTPTSRCPLHPLPR